MLTLDDARRRAGSSAGPLDPVIVPLTEATGLRTAEPVRADVDLPPGPVSAMDGYAARSADIRPDRPLPVALEIQAGMPSGPLPGGTAARIFTGAVLPAGADCVVPQERAEPLDRGGARTVRLPETAVGACVRSQGEVFRRGDVLLAAGTRLDATSIALAAAGAGVPLRVHPRPRVGILTTGTELTEPGRSPDVAQIRDSNTPMLAALATEAALAVSYAGRAPDERRALIDALGRALAAADLVVTSGGVSVGDYDLVPDAIAELGGTTVLHGVAMRPGKPVLVARVRDRLLVGLPGNPVSALVGWRLFVRPLAEAMAGDRRAFEERPLPLPAGTRIEAHGTRLLLLPATIRSGPGGPALFPVTWRGSHDVRGVAGATALARLEAGTVVAAGERVGCYPLPWQWSRNDGGEV